MTGLFARQALLPSGWASDVLLDVADDGEIASVAVGATAGGAEVAVGPVLPGMPNLHSHAFQRVMAGAAEMRGGDGDSFWTWREAMYALVRKLTPEHIHAITAQLYAELLRGGFTSVAEFHYVHRAPDAGLYDDPAEMSLQVIEAARRAGIGITHLPVLYARGGFGGEPLAPAQVRFASDAVSVLRIVEILRARYADNSEVRIGLAPHSLRAVAPEALREAVSELHGADTGAPVHIHVAEQTREVDACVAATGARPVQWLLDHAGIDRRWCLVHATHMNDEEIERLARSGAVAGLCPTTEANLGDGLFPLSRYLAASGHFGVGTDSHVSRDAAEELRWLEYGQRLRDQRRNIAASTDTPSVGGTLWRNALAGGARALARPVGALAAGRRADLIVLDGNHIDLASRNGDALLDGLIFSGAFGLVRDVMVGGHWRVRDGCHHDQAAIEADYRAAIPALRAG